MNRKNDRVLQSKYVSNLVTSRYNGIVQRSENAKKFA